jgi:enoyl-CoA hydratase/carnithine racemase
MSDIADKIYAATGLTLGAEEAAKIGQMIQVENEKLRAAVQDLAKHVWRGDWDKLKPETRELLDEGK